MIILKNANSYTIDQWNQGEFCDLREIKGKQKWCIFLRDGTVLDNIDADLDNGWLWNPYTDTKYTVEGVNSRTFKITF